MAIGESYGKISDRLDRQVFRSKSVLSDLANGKRKRPPSIGLLQALHGLASVKAEAAGIAVLPWDELNKIWEALTPPPPIKPPTCPACGAAAPYERAQAGKEPTSTSVRNPRAADVPSLPVPPPRGDRQQLADVRSPSIAVVEACLAAGDLEGAVGLLHHAGAEAPPDETAAAIAACADRSLFEAVGMIAKSAANRSDRDVLRVLYELNVLRRHAEAELLLGLALGMSANQA
ncbi:hypothetical protein [Streptomyces sp. RPT161]|uniref:hypothetical protein n=1 Tax=Streptomyces sp. RPT161 TaxID=3015993 RepID=UPI0022B9365F|nr:hypothetical protein [Streptomyces sp. RPT161]